MIGLAERYQGRDWAKPFNGRGNQFHISERVAGPLQKQHWDFDARQVKGAVVRRFIGWMERKPEKDQTMDVRQWRLSLGL